ncbi:marvel domain-containing protein [Apodospora peruviana]|uniref:Marvel domain-containing protein n=1 Tax=Apodospora peruviana TaxID=516989 RepID=A0AAE0IHP2_9PEZI|nr:marvel domain-containing protein [Apodospora peruviana]
MEMIHVALRALQLLWILLLTALIGNVIANNVNAFGSATAAVNFSMFVIVLSWLAALFGLASAFVERIAIPMALMGLDALATLFTFISAVVLAAKLGPANCADTKGHGPSWIAFGSYDTTKRCRELQASTAFMWFLFATFAAGLFFTFMSFRRTGGSVRSGPTMSQVRV